MTYQPHQAEDVTLKAAQDDGGPEEFARQRPFRALVTEFLRTELGSVEADNTGKSEFMFLVRLAERAALLSQGVPPTEPAPTGWKLVPIEPTTQMLDAFNSYAQCEGFIPEGYAAMLAAAPAIKGEEP